MAYTSDPGYVSRVLASAMGRFLPVKSSASTARGAVPAASINDVVLGLVQATIGTYGLAETVQVAGVAKAIAAASLGPGALVAVGSSNGRLIPIAASGGPASANLVAVRYTVGVSEEAAVDGGIFSVLLDPAQVV